MDERRDKTVSKMSTEFEYLRKSLFLWFVVLLLSAVVVFPFSLGLFQKIYYSLVPQNIKLLILNPLNPFLIQIQVTLFFAFLFSLPILTYKILFYIFPALYKKEKKAILNSLMPSGFLFILGCFFAYFILVPLTLKVMNSYNTVLNATVYFEINQFITFALFAVVVTGVAFMLPIFMKTLSVLGLVSRSLWIKNFRFSLIAIVIATAIITPDGTGVTMLMLSLPLISLYLLGCIISNDVNKEVNLIGT